MSCKNSRPKSRSLPAGAPLARELMTYYQGAADILRHGLDRWGSMPPAPYARTTPDPPKIPHENLTVS